MAEAILSGNAGSSSIKFALFDLEDSDRLTGALRGQVAAIGSMPRFTTGDAGGAVLADESWAKDGLSSDAFMGKVITWIEAHLGNDALVGVGHRVVHDGAEHARPERVTTALLADLGRPVPMARLHEPHNTAAIQDIAAMRPLPPQVARFGTAFHQTMPAVAHRFALPREYESAGVRRHGSHGIFVATALAVTGLISSFGLFHPGERVFHLDRVPIQTLMYLKLSVAGHLTIFLTHTRGSFRSILPARILWMSVLGT